MYEAHFGLSEKPFSLMPDPKFLYLGEQHGAALSMLEYGITEGSGFSVITGEVGSGKTTLVRRIVELIDPDFSVGLITNTHPRFGTLLKWISLSFGLAYKDLDEVEIYEGLIEFAIEEYARNHRMLLVIDEAQNMTVEILEELRTLSNVNADGHLILQLLIVGQPELLDNLRRPELRQFRQRISAQYHLNPLSRAETREYIAHRLRVAQGDPKIIADGVADVVYDHTDGVPRLINTLCDSALLYSYSEDRNVMDEGIVREVLRDKTKYGLDIFETTPAE